MSQQPKSDGIRTLRELIDYRSAENPASTFLTGPETGRILTFADLQKLARARQGQLHQAGLEPGDKIAFLMDNGLSTAELFLSLMYGGFVAVPLNVRAGVTQLSYTLDHCDAKAVFVEEQYQGLIKEVLAEVLRSVQIIPANVDDFAAETSAGSVNLPPPPTAQDVALLMYTSGSTGQPKAAIHTHSTILAQARNSILSHQLTSADRSLLVLPLYHINAECVTLIPTLLSGGSVVVPHKFVVSQFWDWIDEHRCTWSALVPTIISQLLDWKDSKADQRAAAFKRIRFLRSSSAPLSPALHREFIEKFHLPLIQAMGSTEAGNIFSNPVPPGVNKIGSPGPPWGFEARIVDRNGADLPPNEPGEVLLRGPAMTKGYYKDPIGTAAAFDTEGWLHTGDLAYRDDDGYFFVVGRSKELIIKGGMNIAPKQIDEVLESHPAILEAAAVGVPDRYVGEDLIAFAVLRDGLDCDEKELLNFCESRLGHFKTPTRIHFVEDLPKGPSGKVQRLRLVEEAAKPSIARSVTMGGNAAASNHASGPLPSVEALEKTVIDVWTELLPNKPGVDRESNFFVLGGHSLMAIQCLSKLRQKVPVILSLSDFFENAAVHQLAAVIRQRLASSPAPAGGDSAPALADEEPIPMRNKSLPCPLSPAQQRIWFIDQLVPEAVAYNESEAVRLVGDLNVEALEKGFNIIAGRHELLRSTIEAKDGRPYFVVHDDWKLIFKQIDLSDLAAAEREAEVARLLISEPRIPYHLAKTPGIRVTLVRVAPQEHVLILMMSHIICDWSSEGVLWRELSALYRALLHDQPLVLPPLPIQHGDYAAWQQENGQPANFKADLAYWKEALRGASELIELPADRPRPPANTYRGARRRFRVEPTATEALRHLSRREKTSLFTIFGAALNALLHRYNRSGDVLLGIPLADRDRAELQTMIGFLLHTQVLRTAVEDEMTFSSLVSRVQKGTVDMFSHRAAPFDLVVRELGHERNLAFSPLFQVMLNWRDREQELSFIGLEGLQIESLLAEAHTAKFDLTFMFTDEGDEFVLEMEYSTDLFDEERIVRMVGHYFTLLEAAASNPEQKISQLPLLTAPEREQLLIGWNGTQADYPRGGYVHELFSEQAAKTPDAVAVVFEDKELTYRELDAKSNQLARHLRKLGVKSETLVGVCVERSVEMIIGLLGILKAGGAYVPLDPRYPKDRVEFVLRDAAASVLLTQASLAGDISGSEHAILLDADWAAIATESDAKLDSTTSGEDLAYVIYTSGSTGLPKGVEIPHEALINFLWSMKKSPGLSAEDVLLAVTTISFDIAGLELFLPLITGAKLVVLSREDATNGSRLLHHLTAHDATVLQATPATWRLLLEVQWPGSPNLKMLCGGEAMPRDFADQLLAKGGELWNMYGPTETTIWSAVARVEPDQPIHIGRPIANTSIFILDSQLNPAPIGVPGELHIGGIGLARGYHNREKLTAEKFIPDPFSNDPKARIYKTGDLARYLPDGNIEHLGRLDHQVKLRGFRIELGEIEEVLNQYPGVQACAVIAREDSPGNKRLIAYVVSANGPASPSEWRDHLRAKLPDYMVPATFVSLPTLPLTPNSKVDRKALPQPDFEAATDKNKFIAPNSPIEQNLAAIWAKVLGLAKVGVNDNFFDLGGHSLLLVRVQSQLNEVLKTNVSIVDLFQYPTIRSLVAHLANVPPKADRLPKVQDRAEKRAEALSRQRQKRARP
jgi:amino acid adenylation domain-containing protein